MQAPKIKGRPPALPMAIIGPMKEKLVPCTQSSPQPTGPKRRDCIKVATPETNNDMETRKPVVDRSIPSALAMISGGVIMAIKMAKRC